MTNEEKQDEQAEQVVKAMTQAAASLQAIESHLSNISELMLERRNAEGWNRG